MAIQLPRIKQNDVVGAVPLPKAEAVGSEGIASIAKGNVKLIEGTVDVVDKQVTAYDKMVDDAAKSKAKELSVKYNTAVDALTAEFAALPLGADLTDNYLDLKKQQDSNRERALELAKNPRAKEYLRQSLLEQDSVLNRPIEMKYAQSNIAKDIKNASDKNEISKRNFVTQSAFFDPKDPTSYNPLDGALNEIDVNAKEVAQALGLTSKDSSGQPIYSDNVEKEVRGSKSEAVKQSVSGLLAANDTQKASAIFERYGDLLTDNDRTLIQTKLQGAAKNAKVYSVLNDIKDLPEPTAIAAIETIQDDSTREIVSQKYSGAQSRKSRALDRGKKDAENKIYELISQSQSSSDPLETIEEIKNSRPELFNPIKNDQQAVNRINNALNKRPYNTDFEQYDKVVDAIHSGAAYDWGADQLRENTSGINKKDYNKIYNKIMSLKNNTPSPNGLKARQVNDISSKVKLTLTGSALLPSRKGQLTEVGRKNWALKLDNEVDEEIGKLKPEDATPAKMQKTVNDIVSKIYSINNVKQGEPQEGGFNKLMKNLFSF